jgi:hypothetical protein
MSIKRRDPNSGAIIYEQTPEEKLMENLRLDVKNLKKEVLNFKNFQTTTLTLIQQLYNRIEELEREVNK